MSYQDALDTKFTEWTAGKKGREAMIAVYYRVRDIPYAVLPELNSPVDWVRILELNMGSCTPKHLLLANMFRRLGLNVLYAVYPYHWAEFEELYPPELWKLALRMPPVNHLACKVEINGRFVLVDATIDPPLGKIGLPMNATWDGKSDTILPVLPIGEEEIYSQDEAGLMPPPDVTDEQRAFYRGLNMYFQRIRDGQH
jgi:transglutaminase-like putative cysteine protease